MFYIVLLFLMIRPLLDLLSDYRLMGMNVAGAYSLVIIAIAIANLLYNSSRKIKQEMFSIVVVRSFGILMIFLIPSAFFSKNFMDVFSSFLQYLTLISVAYLLVLYSKNKHQNRLLINAVIVSFLISSIFSFYQLIFSKGLMDYQVGGYRVYSTFTHPNQFAFYLTYIITILILLYKNNYFKNKISFIILFGLAFVQLLFTYCRSAWIWLAFILIGYILSSNMKKKTILILLFGICFIALYPFVMGRFNDYIDPNSRNSMDSRYKVWADMLSLINNNNKFYGIGMGSFVRYNMLYFDSNLPAHNEYIHYYVESGIFGIVGFSLFFIITFNYIRKIKSKDKWIYLSLMIGLLVICYSSNIFSMLVSQIYFVCIFTLIKRYSKKTISEMNTIENN